MFILTSFVDLAGVDLLWKQSVFEIFRIEKKKEKNCIFVGVARPCDSSKGSYLPVRFILQSSVSVLWKMSCPSNGNQL